MKNNNKGKGTKAAAISKNNNNNKNNNTSTTNTNTGSDHVEQKNGKRTNSSTCTNSSVSSSSSSAGASVASVDTIKVGTSSTSTSTSTSTSSSSSIGTRVVRNVTFLLLWGIIPYCIGYIVTINHSSESKVFLQPLLNIITEPIYHTLIYFAIIKDENIEFVYESTSTTKVKTTKKSRISTKQQRQTKEEEEQQQQLDGTTNNSNKIKTTNKCYERFQKLLSRTTTGGNNIVGSNNNTFFHNISIVVHRNGESQSCGSINDITTAFYTTLIDSYDDNVDCTDSIFTNKYVFESLFTEVLGQHIHDTCYSTEIDRSKQTGFFGYCDMGESKTPILPDHKELVSIESDIDGMGEEDYLPCHFHSKNGIRISSLTTLIALVQREPKQRRQLQKIQQLDTERERRRIELSSKECTFNFNGELEGDGCSDMLNDNTHYDIATMASTTIGSSGTDIDNDNTINQFHIYAVPAGRVFIHSADYIGQIIPIPHVSGGNPKLPIYLKVLATEPKVFDVVNFFSLDESNTILQNALSETKESHRIKRSSTGATGYNLFDKRTSESGFDTDTPTSVRIKKRGFDMLGFDSYIESFADGLQILRYNLTKAYVPHLDWIDGNDQLEHNYESSLKGGNRFATILLYFSNLGIKDGGETVFTETYPVDIPVDKRIDYKTALRELRESPQGKVLTPNSWEEDMVTQCRTKLAIQPQAARAVLFYSQLPNGQADQKSKHGGCPVLNGTKYAANLWVWNTARDGYPNNPKNPNYKGTSSSSGEVKKEEHPGRVNGVFSNSKTNPQYEHAELYYMDTFWAKLGFNDPDISVNTYPSHVWHVKVNGAIVKTFTITTSDPEIQHYKI